MTRLRAAALVLACLVQAAEARADGKFFFREEVPAGREPFQRAVLAHQDGREFLLIQRTLVGSAREFGWIVPVPSEPAVGFLTAEEAGQVFYNLDQLLQPSVVHLQPWLAVFGLLACLGFAAAAVVSWGRRRSRAFMVGAAVSGAFFLLTLSTVTMASKGAGFSDVEVLLESRLGMYDTAVIRSDVPGAAVEWLKARGFRFGPEDEAVFRDEESRGWCFVASRIAADATKDAGPYDGMLDALLLSFDSPEPVYPFALTATSPGPTDVLLYAFSDHKLGHPALETRQAGELSFDEVRAQMQRVAADVLGEGHHGQLVPYVPSPTYSTKLRGTVSRVTCPGDIVLRAAADDAPVRPSVYTW